MTSVVCAFSSSKMMFPGPSSTSQNPGSPLTSADRLKLSRQVMSPGPCKIGATEFIFTETVELVPHP